jgi:hypothetical protein
MSSFGAAAIPASASTGSRRRRASPSARSTIISAARIICSQLQLAAGAFRTFGERLSGTPEQIAATLFDDLAVWSARPDFAGTGFTRFVIELADMPGHPARVIAVRHKAMIEGELAKVLVRARVPAAARRARELML